jgi:hypothetical protein
MSPHGTNRTKQCHALAPPPASHRRLYSLEHMQLDTDTDLSSNITSIGGQRMHAPNCIEAGMDAHIPLSCYKYSFTVHARRVLLDTLPAKTAQKESHQARYQSTASSCQGPNAQDCNASRLWLSAFTVEGYHKQSSARSKQAESTHSRANNALLS